MRRTYRSKKDTTNVVERRDLFQNLDGKSSAYDAFSIHNIKQTKRELSCVGSTNALGVASSRVRKKKYVKRIVKDVETPCRESLSRSTYLTPDKSIRVNKPLDPFDLLLMTSPARPVNAVDTVTSKVDVFDQLVAKKESKTYIRRKPKKVKQFNYSSTESSDSDKENFDTQNVTPNTTDIRTHKLLIEHQVKPTPSKIDESINNIVNNLSLINKLKYKYNNDDSINKSIRFNRHRLTKTIQSPLLQKSPLCSTPFKVKYRSESIFKFSPITAANNDNSPAYNTESSDNDRSIILQSSKVKSPVERENKAVEIVPLDKNDSEINDDQLNDDNNEVNKESDVEVEKASTITDSKEIPSIEISSFQTTESEPFYGFVHNETKSQNVSNLTDDSVANNNITEVEVSNNCPNLAEEANNELAPDEISQFEIEESQYFEGENSQVYEGNASDEKSNASTNDGSNNCSQFSEGNNITRYEINENRQDDEQNEDIYGDDHSNTSNDDSDSSSERKDESKLSNGSSDANEIAHNETNSKNVSNLTDDSVANNDITEVEVSDSCPNLAEEANNGTIPDDISQFEIEESQYFEGENSEIYEGNAADEKSNASTNDGSNDYSQLSEEDNVTRYEINENRQADEQNDESDSITSTDDSHSSIEKDESKLTNASIDANETRLSEISEENSTNDKSAEEDNDSFYDTCTSDQSSIQETECVKEPVVVLERMDDSIFFKYYNKTTRNSDIDEHSFNSEFASIRDSNDSKESSDVENCDENDDRTDDDVNSSSNNDDEKCLSFVTTRRRNEVTNDSMISMFNDSNCSSSTDCDKTVLCNNIEKTLDKTLEHTEDKDVVKTVESPIEYNKNISYVSTRNSFVSDRRSSRKSSIRPKTNLISKRTSKLPIKEDVEESMLSCVDHKPGIVLQPGKKWERSLSIYRRMTMTNDHFDRSMLDEADTTCKGRKYRQSIISTMEMQDFNSSLHNESINSRRSTFVSKPSRSTIVIVKDPNGSRFSLCNTTVFDDLKGFLNEECDDTIIELSKLSIADQTHEVTVLDNFHDTPNPIATARDYVLRRCNQTDAILFDECYPDTVLKNCHKIGEGVYGEVFLWRARDGRARVLKIVPIAGNLKVNGESQKDFHEIISEIVIAMELSALRAPIAEIERHLDEGKDVGALDLHAIENASDIFNEVLAVRCVYGSYPSRLLDLWDLYDECKGSENDNPAILPVDQQYIVLELANAGQDLESYQFNNAEQAHALFLQVAYGLAVAEEAFQFEHRDLHWGNVLIAPTEQKSATFVIRGRLHRVARCGVRATIIDYSLSRVSLRLAAGDSAALYNDLATDESLFDAVGDYQFQVYRLMRDKLGNDWKNFEPYTNILWLHYTVDKMITALRYKRTNTKIHKHYIDKLKGIKSRILDYGSAAQFVLTDNEI